MLSLETYFKISSSFFFVVLSILTECARQNRYLVNAFLSSPGVMYNEYYATTADTKTLSFRVCLEY